MYHVRHIILKKPLIKIFMRLQKINNVYFLKRPFIVNLTYHNKCYNKEKMQKCKNAKVKRHYYKYF